MEIGATSLALAGGGHRDVTAVETRSTATRNWALSATGGDCRRERSFLAAVGCGGGEGDPEMPGDLPGPHHTAFQRRSTVPFGSAAKSRLAASPASGKQQESKT